MKKKMERDRRGWYLWIGGACFLVGSLVAGSVGLASSAGNPSPGLTANQGAPGTSSWPVTASQGSGTGSGGAWKVDGSGVTQPVSGTVGLSPGSSVGISGSLPAGTNNVGNVGISGSLPAGTNDIGTVHVAAPNLVAGNAHCQVPDGVAECSTGTGQPHGTIFNTLSVVCNLQAGQHVSTTYANQGGGVFIGVPLSFQESSGGIDEYAGTLTNLGVPTGGVDSFNVQEDYTAGSPPGNGAACELSFTGTTS